MKKSILAAVTIAAVLLMAAPAYACGHPAHNPCPTYPHGGGPKSNPCAGNGTTGPTPPVTPPVVTPTPATSVVPAPAVVVDVPTVVTNTVIEVKPYSSLTTTYVRHKPRSTVYRFQADATQLPTLTASWWKHTSHGYVPTGRVETLAMSGTAPIWHTGYITVARGYSIKVRTVDPTSNTVVRIG